MGCSVPHPLPKKQPVLVALGERLDVLEEVRALLPQ